MDSKPEHCLLPSLHGYKNLFFPFTNYVKQYEALSTYHYFSTSCLLVLQGTNLIFNIIYLLNSVQLILN